jgi:hypothetical protein
MAVELRWIYRLDHATGEPQWTSANYNSSEEALLQAAHNHLIDASVQQEIHGNGKMLHDRKSIAAAAKKLDAARDTNGFRPHFEAASELKATI